ncbi:hypothetical protein LTR08_005004 [Meristemomyces frigidus]|nr:hypothetical protein LTR08_005004 [Meristemomyces frigidus]
MLRRDMRWPGSLLVLFVIRAFLVASTATCDPATFSSLLDLSTNATFKSAISVAANGTYGGGGFALDPGFPGNATGLPALCAVTFSVMGSGAWPLFNFGMFLPDAWNERVIGSGNTGFGGGIDWPEMAPLTHYGFATISTDTGHLSGPGDAKWANQSPSHQALWGGLAMHQSVVLAKQIITGYYGQNATYSYYSACSGGGRQGLKEVQTYPGDYDGVIAGAAPWLLSHLHPWAVHVAMPNLLADDADKVTDAHFDAFASEVVRQCDAIDRLVDQVVTDPYGCEFDYTALLCNSTYTNTSICFSTGQLDVLEATYADWMNSTDNSSLIWPSFSLTAKSEGLVGSKINGTPSSFGTSYVENFVVGDDTWDWHTLSDSTVNLADTLNRGSANADEYDLSSFKYRGGKLLTYHGLSDPLIPTGSSIYYYEQVLSAMSNGSSTASQNTTASTSTLDDFYRMFLVPGMGHCSRGTHYHPWYFAGAGQEAPVNSSGYSVPGFEDADHDIVLALMAWVENGTAPASLVATEWHGRDVAQGVSMQRPVCPYPQQAKYQSGAVEQAGSWSCTIGGNMVGYSEMVIAQKQSTETAVPVAGVAAMAAVPPGVVSVALILGLALVL